MNISEPAKKDFEELAELWETSVRASHFFLEEKDIPKLKEEILGTYLGALSLRMCTDGRKAVLGFVGVNGDKVEMLFVAPEHWGKGVGKRLLTHAIREMGIRRLDVNEDNPAALNFYLHMGFEVTGRSSLDGQGRAYPLLHLELKQRDKCSSRI